MHRNPNHDGVRHAEEQAKGFLRGDQTVDRLGVVLKPSHASRGLRWAAARVAVQASVLTFFVGSFPGAQLMGVPTDFFSTGASSSAM